LRSKKFVLTQLNHLDFDTGICFSYNPKSQGCCYNASMHAAECLARVFYFTKDVNLLKIIEKVVDFVTYRQKDNGVWYYSFQKFSDSERKQIDFHQGFILESYYEIVQLTGFSKPSWEEAIEKGLSFYMNNQFESNGRSLWRIPKIFPIDIHNQAQGIITFSIFGDINPKYHLFAKKIATWTIKYMQNRKDGSFYYRINKNFINKIPYMRWSQAWMLLAFSVYLKKSLLEKQ